MYSTTDEIQSGSNASTGIMKGKMFHKLGKLSNSVGHEMNSKNHFYNNFRKNKRTASVADSQQKRGLNNSLNISNLNKENAYRYMSVTPNHKYHEAKKNKLFTAENSNTMNINLFKTSTQRLTNNSSSLAPPKYKNNTPIEELKDEYNDSKLSFNASEESGEVRNDDNRTLSIDLESIILVEDKICALSSNVIQEYWEVTNAIYQKINDQLDLLAGDIKNIKIIKVSLILEYIVVICISTLSNDPKLPKGSQIQFKNLNYYIHQNILLLIDIIMLKLPHNENTKDWMSNLKTIIDNKLAQMSIKSRGLNDKHQSQFDIIMKNCESIIPIVKNIVTKKPTSTIPKKGK